MNGWFRSLFTEDLGAIDGWLMQESRISTNESFTDIYTRNLLEENYHSSVLNLLNVEDFVGENETGNKGQEFAKIIYFGMRLLIVFVFQLVNLKVMTLTPVFSIIQI